MKNLLAPKAHQRALAGLMSITVVASGLGVVATTPAFATEVCASVQAPGNIAPEDMTLTIDNADVKNFRSGDTIHLTASGVAPRSAENPLVIKINKGANNWVRADQAQGSNLEISGTETESPNLIVPSDLFANGELDIHVVLPQDLPNGQNFLTVLGGGQGGERLSYSVPFFVDNTAADDGLCGTLTIQSPEIKSVTGYATDSRRAKAGEIRVSLVVEGMMAGATPTMSIGTQALTLPDDLVVDPAGVLKTTVTLPVGSALAGAHMLTVSDGTTTKELRLLTTGYAMISENAAQGSQATVRVVNLPDGTELTSVGVEGQNWLSAPVSAVGGIAEQTGVMVPADAPFREKVRATYSIAGRDYTVDTGERVNAPRDLIATELYDSQSMELGKGLYQSAINDKTGKLFVTRANRREDSSIYKIDAKTFTIEQTLDIQDRDSTGESVRGAFGVGLDNERGLVWVSNTLQDTVSVYRQSDLSLVKTWSEGSTAHPRDVVIDEKTGLAYVSMVSRATGAVHIYDLEADAPVAIDLGPDFAITMSLALNADKGLLYTTSRVNPNIAKIDIASANKQVTTKSMDSDLVESASGVALDPVHNKLYITAQGTGNTVVFDADTMDFITEIPTGASALNARYNPSDGRIYVAHRKAGTVVAIDTETDTVVARLDAGMNTNHISVGADGTVYAVNKASQADPEAKDRLFAFKLKEQRGDDMSSSGPLPMWATVLISITSILGIFGLIIGGLRNLAMQFGIRLPF
ncbi:YncE family protein [Corynebacterium sp. ES2775-CONJ]|uniref:YncE family protein n=1 Tax=Corynebacterium sp. ES2775-CONJ TaxID=2974029 RepID=UPI00216994E1|nr:YncE family protein [Corynebacterium sp. ES2775-CONJ]MCS4489633.1 YncE family protein [Corynebacterium sp. ES2775-CONJ]